MKTKNIFTVMIALLLSAQVQAGENTVEYGEKYKCEIVTTDQKNYVLDIGWSIGESKKIFFTLVDLENQKIVNKVFLNKVHIDSPLYSLTLQASKHNCLRPGCHNENFLAEFEIYRLAKLKKFQYSFVGDGYYAHKEKIDLDIAESKCTLVD